MSRCFQLARLGEGVVAPNPMVGAVLVHEGKIIGEGYHQRFGGPHAEVNCIESVAEEYKHLISSSTMYVSLEPCVHFGKTPPCADLIVRHQIKKVVIGSRDPFAKVNGSGISKLRDANTEVTEGILEDEARELNKKFFYFHNYQRPFVTLKWAETADGFIAGENYEARAISNDLTNRCVHQMRASHQAIMVGFNTAKFDDPALTTRHWPGEHPLRIVIDKRLELKKNSKLLNGEVPTLVLNFIEQRNQGPVEYHLLNEKESILPHLMKLLFERNITSLLVEGGTNLLQSFIDEGYWNEAFRIRATSKKLGAGIAGPIMKTKASETKFLLNDEISIFKKD